MSIYPSRHVPINQSQASQGLVCLSNHTYHHRATCSTFKLYHPFYSVSFISAFYLVLYVPTFPLFLHPHSTLLYPSSSTSYPLYPSNPLLLFLLPTLSIPLTLSFSFSFYFLPSLSLSIPLTFSFSFYFLPSLSLSIPLNLSLSLSPTKCGGPQVSFERTECAGHPV